MGTTAWAESLTSYARYARYPTQETNSPPVCFKKSPLSEGLRVSMSFTCAETDCSGVCTSTRTPSFLE